MPPAVAIPFRDECRAAVEGRECEFVTTLPISWLPFLFLSLIDSNRGA